MSRLPGFANHGVVPTRPENFNKRSELQKLKDNLIGQKNSWIKGSIHDNSGNSCIMGMFIKKGCSTFAEIVAVHDAIHAFREELCQCNLEIYKHYVEGFGECRYIRYTSVDKIEKLIAEFNDAEATTVEDVIAVFQEAEKCISDMEYLSCDALSDMFFMFEPRERIL